MSNELLLAKGLSLPSAAIVESFGIMGRKGGGKTVTGKKLFELMHGVGAQCVGLDPVGKWWGLRLSASGKRTGLDIPVFGGEFGDIPITPEGGKLMAKVVVERRISCVIDLKLFRKNERKRFATDFAEELYFLKSSNRKYQSPLHLFLEEARKFIPQKPMSPDENRMIGAFEDIVRLGRNCGLGSSLIDQRPQSVNKEVLSQVEIFIVHQLTEKHGRKEIEAWVRDKETDGADQLKNIATLHPGEAFLWSPGLLRRFARIKVNMIKTFDSSKTPTMEDFLDEGLELKPLSAKDLENLRDSMVSMVEEAEKGDVKKLQAKLRQAQAQVNVHVKTITHLEEQLESRPAEVEIKTVEVPAVSDKQLARMDKQAEKLLKDIQPLTMAANELTIAIAAVGRAKEREAKAVASARPAKTNGVPARPGLPPRARRVELAARAVDVDNDLNGPEQRIVDAIAWMEGIGVENPELGAVAFLAGYRLGGGAFNNPRGRLRAKGLVEYAPGKRMRLTDAGRAVSNPPADQLTTESLHAAVLEKLGGPEQRILQPLLDAYPNSVTNAALAEAAGYAGGGGAYNNPRGRLRTLGLIDYPEPGHVVARDLLFLDS